MVGGEQSIYDPVTHKKEADEGREIEKVGEGEGGEEARETHARGHSGRLTGRERQAHKRTADE